jgi:hypothetical protein
MFMQNIGMAIGIGIAIGIALDLARRLARSSEAEPHARRSEADPR